MQPLLGEGLPTTIITMTNTGFESIDVSSRPSQFPHFINAYQFPNQLIFLLIEKFNLFKLFYIKPDHLIFYHIILWYNTVWSENP